MGAARKLVNQSGIVNAVVYCRYSSTNQNEQSIEGQLRECHAYAKREGYNIVGEYIDRALSGRSDERPQFRQMIADSAKGQFQIVIVWKLDRFARNRYDSAHYKHILKKNGVRVVSATEKISNDPEGIVLEGIIETISEYFSANLAQNVMRGQRENMAKGLHVGGYAPYGYEIVDKKLVVIEDEARVIRYAFEQYASGVEKVPLIKELAAMGLVSKAGKPIGFSTLYNIFRNTKYIGVYRFGEGEVMGGCPPIVDKEVFDKVQARVASKARGKNKGEEYLLSGKVFCGMCGEKLFGNSSYNKKGVHYSYYQCMGRKFKRNCLKKSEKKGFLEWYVVEQTCEYVLQPTRMEYIASRIVARYDDEFSAKAVTALEKQLSQIERDINAAADATIKAPESARQVFYDKLEVLTAQKADIEHELTIKRIASRQRLTHEDIMIWLKRFTKGDEMEDDFQRRIIDVFINSIYVYDDKIVIYYNIKDGKQISYIDVIDSLEESIEDVPLNENPQDCAVSGASKNLEGEQPPFRKRFQISTLYAAVCSSFNSKWNSS